METPWWERLTELDLFLMSRAMLSKSLIQFSVDGWGCVPSLLFGLRAMIGVMVVPLQKDLGTHCCIQCP